jgi:hypothetical protein
VQTGRPNTCKCGGLTRVNAAAKHVEMELPNTCNCSGQTRVNAAAKDAS